MPPEEIARLLECADTASAESYAPFSRRPIGAVVLLEDGAWIPGVRVENASFPLTIPALVAAYATSRCAGRADIVAVAQNQPFREADAVLLADALGGEWRDVDRRVLLRTTARNVPSPTHRLDVHVSATDSADDRAMLDLADDVARRAYVPESGFPVGCIITAENGALIPGCNVEHGDWTRGLCAERVALATALAYGHRAFRRIHVSCPNESSSSCCGACRQVLFELAETVPVVLGRGPNPPEVTTPRALLPGGFRGESLRN